ncbi:MAG: hypothetical protein HXX15_12305 [Rhodopseudomonas sp.]|uniref:hypothetical protein n=1 Tax=Rhodopseudomonas sp. TaxID=1078 RepID=UPI00182DC81F|nr:hypothetical protein [Rhodopseudomonas sp.]NVN86857.1 hypothetical protein [Rhodopseudomonas sp.]
MTTSTRLTPARASPQPQLDTPLKNRPLLPAHRLHHIRPSGKPGAVQRPIEIDLERRNCTIEGRQFLEGDQVSIDGTTGKVFEGALKLIDRKHI